ncbi:putative glycosidase crf2 [Choanephora cucurbitarum]|uniref:Putative glycosidase crf2 n=1 Tax=Choanephora cucurbitarum TaxID=101091 RepID=A0A1C7NL57_9FUNG|nr:putative glycosidase crf2 [Choanephora cucurbitarum]
MGLIPNDEEMISSAMQTSATTNRVSHLKREYTSSGQEKPVCHNLRTDFTKDPRGWAVENTMQDTYDVDQDGVKLILMGPKEYVRLHDAKHMPYNQSPGRGPTLNATNYMLYGRVSARLKTATDGGVITAFILLADGGDEIDFEMIGNDLRSVQTNYFWGKLIEYNVNGAAHQIEGPELDKDFHQYTIDWTPDKIDWIVDGRVIRTKKRSETCDPSGVCKFPSQPSRVQIGIWDGSSKPGTAEWSRGPIDVSQSHTDFLSNC